MHITAQDRAKLRAFIAGLLQDRNDAAPFSDADSLLDSGRLDSLATTEVVAFLESEFRADFLSIDFDPARFDSVNSIAALLGEMLETA